jgi:SAM-dependent methyltransferase
MSGFDTVWLDLREPADHAARDRGLLEVAALRLADSPAPLIADLGCGTGSTFRAFAGRLPTAAQWRLLDHDPALLAAARTRLPAIGVSLREADLRDIDALPLGDVDLVTASALFDLVSRDWAERLAGRLAGRRTALYAVLNYDGRMTFGEPHEEDRRVVDAFNRHQRGDKGFGPALGPDAARALAEIFGRAGYSVSEAESPWHLVAGPLHDETLRGVAHAARETGHVSPIALNAWLDFRLGSVRGFAVGHRDILATS